MPLKKVPKGATKKEKQETISKNISEMVKSGHSLKQSIAAAISDANKKSKPKKKK